MPRVPLRAWSVNVERVHDDQQSGVVISIKCAGRLTTAGLDDLATDLQAYALHYTSIVSDGGRPSIRFDRRQK